MYVIFFAEGWLELNSDLWKKALSLLKYDPSMDDVIYESMLDYVEPVHLNNDVLVLSCRDEFSLNIVKNREISTAVKNAVSHVAGKDITVNFILKGDDKALVSSTIPFAKRNDDSKPSSYSPIGLSPDYTFDNFIVGECNRFAHATAVSVANHPGLSQRNPFYIWGNSGLGKTHLMKAIGYFITQNFKDKTVLYNTCEEFTNSFVACSRASGNYEDFRNKYRNVDVLLIDDIQFIIGKEGTQIEFFNTFDSLISSGKQIVITSDKAPKNLTELDSRFTSRFTNGMIMDIQPPDFETRKAILMNKIERDGIILDDDIVNYICENVTQNIRDLNGAYNIVSSYYVLSNGDLTLETVQAKLASIISPGANKTITVEMIVDMVSRYYSVSPDNMMSSKRNAEIFKPRSVAMYICRDLLDMQYKKIGENFGGKTHTTVMHALEKVENDPDLMGDVKHIEKKLSDF